MSGNLALLESRKKELHTVLSANMPLIAGFNEKDKKKFAENFIEIANNDYLMKTITDKKLILRLAISLTKQGIDVHPSKKQCYIIPFDTKVDGLKVMIPQEVIPFKGHQQKALINGFMLKAFQVWKVNGEAKCEKNMSYEELTEIDDTNDEYRESNFYGWEFELIDLKEVLPKQTKFVSFKYAKTASKNMNTPKEFLLQGLLHKAVRRAMVDFAMPSDRDPSIVVEAIEPTVTVQKDPMDDVIEGDIGEQHDPMAEAPTQNAPTGLSKYE